MVEEVRALIDDAGKAKVAQHDAELEAMDAREEQLGTRGSGRKDLEARHRRELRQFRTEELRFGLATLATRYRERLSQATIAAVCSTVSMRCVTPRTPWCATPTRRWRSKPCC